MTFRERTEAFVEELRALQAKHSVELSFQECAVIRRPTPGAHWLKWVLCAEEATGKDSDHIELYWQPVGEQPVPQTSGQNEV